MKKISIILIIILLLNSCNNKNVDSTSKKEIDSTNNISTSNQAVDSKKDSSSQKDIEESQKTLQIDLQIEENLSDNELWEKYRDSRAKANIAHDNHLTELAVKHLLEASEYAQRLNRNDIAAWQLNNAGFYCIQKFRRLTSYDRRMTEIENMVFSEVKTIFINETKKIFNEHIYLLKDATIYLEKAYELDSSYDDASRTKSIYNNIKFVDWVRNFTNHKN